MICDTTLGDLSPDFFYVCLHMFGHLTFLETVYSSHAKGTYFP